MAAAPQLATGGKAVLRLVGGIFAIIGVVLLGIGAWIGNRQYTILQTWPIVQAEVSKSRVTRGRDSEGTAMYGTEIEFRYTVEGKQYLTPSSSAYTTSSYRDMKRQADQYAPGTRHVIRYNPAEPDDIRFDAGFNFGFFLFPSSWAAWASCLPELACPFCISRARDRPCNARCARRR